MAAESLSGLPLGQSLLLIYNVRIGRPYVVAVAPWLYQDRLAQQAGLEASYGRLALPDVLLPLCLLATRTLGLLSCFPAIASIARTLRCLSAGDLLVFCLYPSFIFLTAACRHVS